MLTWTFNENPKEKNDPLFKYPSVLAAATNSVTTRFNPRPQTPRFTAEQKIDVLEFVCSMKPKLSHFTAPSSQNQNQLSLKLFRGKYVMMDSALALKV